MHTNLKSKIINRLKLFALLFICFFLFNCVSSKKINYLNFDDQVYDEEIVRFEPTLQVSDMLTINVSTVDEEAAKPFNLFEVQTVAAQVPLSYIIDIDGNINFPVLGNVKAAGLTTKKLTDDLKEKLKPYLKDPIINIRVTNFNVTILGEVRNPGRYQVLNERISILEALGRAGDLTIYADRQNVTLVREQGKTRIVKTIDLTSKDLLDSPYFYLAQNDALYVASNKTKVNSSGVGPNTSIIISAISVLITLVAILVR